MANMGHILALCDELEGMLGKATGGEWVKGEAELREAVSNQSGELICDCWFAFGNLPSAEDDAALIAAAHNALPDLIAAIREMRTRLEMATCFDVPGGYEITTQNDDAQDGWVVYRDCPAQWLGHDSEWHECVYREERDSYPTADAAFAALDAWQHAQGDGDEKVGE
ncbi:MAG: hypothetical protein ACM3SS_00725 [Rhodospirillaceae bacterium]